MMDITHMTHMTHSTEMTHMPGSQVVTCPSCEKKNRVPDIALGRPGCGFCKRALPWIVEANDETFVDVVDADLVVLVELYAAWSKPSLLVTPIVQRIALDYSGRLKVVRVNADRARRMQATHRLKGPPTLLIMKHGSLLDTIFGAQPEALVCRHLDDVLLTRT